MRILYLTHYFYPEGNAPATRVYEMSRRWAKMGHEVTVVTGVPNVPSGVVYEGYANRLLQSEVVDGVRTVRVWTYLAANQGAGRRILNYLSYMLFATVVSLWLRRPDVVIATSPQFFCGWAGVWLSRLRRLPFILEIRDIWPESIVVVGAMSNARLIRFLEWLEGRLYRAAGKIVTVGEGYRKQLEARGVPSLKVAVVPNGVDRELFAVRREASGLRSEYGLGDAFVCSYLGTIGMGCGLSVVLRAARILRESRRNDIKFLLVGDGAVREELEQRSRDENLQQHVVFTGRQSKHRMPDFLSISDACLVHLSRNELFRTVMPSKIFEAAAMAKPIVLGVEGFAAEVVERAGAGICIQPENERELVSAVERLASDQKLASELGSAGYERIATQYDYNQLAKGYLGILEALRRGES